MRLKRLSTTHFRNLLDETVSFSPGVNLLVGGNGEGKTNVLEALSIFKIGRSFRTSRDADLIAFSEPFCRVEVAVEKNTAGAGTFALSVERSGDKRIKVDDKELDKLSGLVGLVPLRPLRTPGPRDRLGAAGGEAALSRCHGERHRRARISRRSAGTGGCSVKGTRSSNLRRRVRRGPCGTGNSCVRDAS